MKLKDIQNTFHKELDAIYNKNEVDSLFFILIESFFKVSRIQLALKPDYYINEAEKKSVFEALQSLKQEVPIQYILGETQFYGLTFKVNKHVFIPRPETEELVSLMVQDLKVKVQTSKPLTILDIGTGSGCIAISLAKNLPNAKVYALDVSKEALTIAKQNAALNTIEVAFIEADIFKLNLGLKTHIKNLPPPLFKDDRQGQKVLFDAIVSNPPYVRHLEKKEMKTNVLNNEPHLALFVEDKDPLLFYKAITQFAVHNLAKEGFLFFEINEYLGTEMIALLKDNDFGAIELKQDMFKKDRIIKGIKINKF